QEAACKRDLRGDARPFCADGFFDDLNELGLTALQLFGDVGGRTAARPGRAPAPARRDGLNVSSSIAIPVPVFLVGVVSLTHTLRGLRLRRPRLDRKRSEEHTSELQSRRD